MTYNERNVFDRDGDLRFDPQTHTYTHIGRIEPLTSVTAFIGSFFDPYDPYFWINRDENISEAQRELKKREQDTKGFIARNLGTFMHTQIEKSFLGEPVEHAMELLLEEGEAPKIYDIQTELAYFNDFVRDHRLEPFRTEWMIYDEEHWLAGTLDLLVKEPDGTFTIYDWKRSRRMGREQSGLFYPNRSNFRQKGHGVIAHLDDTPFIHAALQQNLYRAILKQNYGIEVNKMYLVILSPSFTRYHEVEVPCFDNEIKMMLDLY
ncbi:MAG: hypothetical protein Q4E10_01410 [Porphyromonas sp.]|nr:hypothetical protein [Porphyromonas sp.]